VSAAITAAALKPEIHMILITMGVSGCGKSLIGRLLAKRLHCGFSDADSFHSSLNKEKMRSGLPLDDEDRWPWLRATRVAIELEQARGKTHVFACSALKHAYRDVLRGDDQNIFFIYLDGHPTLMKARIESRVDHFFGPALLQSQLDALEPPDDNEAIRMDIEMSPGTIVQEVIHRLARREV
jgi:gluconokinase